jgi:SAM-dependent methyltransferase
MMTSKTKKKKKQRGKVPDRHALYEAAVQNVEADIEFFERVYQEEHGRPFRVLREDFCGTATLACEFASGSPERESWGVDLDRETLEWGREHRLASLDPDARSRVHLLCGDVLSTACSPADLVAALNFSYFVFKTREALLGYFRSARRSLAPGGALVMDLFGGTEAMDDLSESEHKDAVTHPDGSRTPEFTYTWEQADFNPVTHELHCHIHFKLSGGRKVKRAFSYDWRLWTIPEMRELLAEAGFVRSDVYIEGWDDEADESDGVFTRKDSFENQESWLAYVVAWNGA